MEDIHGRGKVDRLPVLITQRSGTQLLGVAKIASGTGEAQADAVYCLLKDWKALKNIIGMCFDTTNPNAGRLNGACSLLEGKLGRSLLRLACRHHIYEIFLRAAYEAKFPGTTAPTVPLFTRFRNIWENIDKKNFQTGMSDAKVKIVLNDEIRAEIIGFCKHELKDKKIARDDYRELLQLTLIFVGGEDPEKIRFRAPGADSHARWMSKAIYSLKIFLFASQVHMNPNLKNRLRDFCLFVVLIYTKAWFRCVRPLEAPKQDLDFLKAVRKFEQIDRQISVAVLRKIRGHLWYLSPETIALSLFDDNVTVEEKRKLSRKLKSMPPPDESTSVDKFTPNQDHFNMLGEKGLDYFITEDTLNFFTRFNISQNFLSKNPSVWPADEDYKNAQALLSSLVVVNDDAERTVKLMEDFNKLITKNEDMLQALLLTVSEYRKKFPGYSKSDLTVAEVD